MGKGEGLFQKICSEAVFREAWRRVKANMGSPGIDRLSIEDFQANLGTNLSLLRDLLQQEVYQPLPLMVKEIPKDDGTKRILKIPSVRDRIVQEAVLLVLQPVWDRTFLDCCYGYRPKKSAHAAVKRIERHLKKGEKWLVDADIEDFFGSVNQDLLITLFGEKIADPRIVRLIKEWIACASETGIGIPQGAVISPLLANIYLHQLDLHMRNGPGHYIRYCDDFVVLCETRQEAEHALEVARQVFENRLRLRVNEAKTRVCSLRDGFVFLGFHFSEKGKRPSQKAIDRLRGKVEHEIKASQHVPDPTFPAKLRSIIRGWQNYFQLAHFDGQGLLEEIEKVIESQPEAGPAHILKAALHIEKGDKEHACNIVNEKLDAPSDDGEVHFQWGILCEALGMHAEARGKYLMTLRTRPDHPEGVRRLGVNYLMEGKIEKAIRFLQKAVSLAPDSPEAHFALGKAFEEWALYGAARKAYDRARELGFDSDKMPVRTKDKEDNIGIYRGEDIELFLRLFSGREGVFAKQWLDSKGTCGYYPVNKPLTKKDVRSHLAGKSTVGLYLMRTDNTVKLAVIDIDVTKKTREEINNRGRQGLEEWRQLALTDARRIANFLRTLQIPIYLESSGWKGAHCWLFLEQPLKASEIRAFLKEIAQRVGPPPGGINREIFPRQDKVSKNALGSLVKLPMGKHMVTQERALFLNDEGQAYENQLGFLWEIRTVSPIMLRKSFAMVRFPNAAPQGSPALDDSAQKLLDKCNVLRYLAKKSEKERDLNHSERLVLLHTLGHLGDTGKQAIHHIIGHCMNYEYGRTERWLKRIKQSPVSCPRIRDWLSDITPSIGCYCEFPAEKGYPTPLLHVDSEITSRTGARDEAQRKEPSIGTLGNGPEEKQEEPKPEIFSDDKSSSPHSEHPDQLVRNYVELKRAKNEIDWKLRQVGEKLEGMFEAKGVNALQTAAGILIRAKIDNKTIWAMEL